MKKAIKFTLITVILGAMFGLGTYAGANNTWQAEVINEANSRIGSAGYHKRDEIVEYNIGDQMKQALDPKIKQYEDELAQMLEEYYQLKIQGIIDGEEITSLEIQMEAKKQEIFERYSADIDAMFGE